MIRSIVSILTALFCAVIIIFLIEYLSQKLYPMPEGLDYDDKEAFGDWVKSLPLTAMLFVLFGWFLGSFLGGYLVSAMDKYNAVRSTSVVGVLLLFSTLLNLYQIPHPAWMWIGGMVAILGGTYLGHRSCMRLEYKNA